MDTARVQTDGVLAVRPAAEIVVQKVRRPAKVRILALAVLVDDDHEPIVSGRHRVAIDGVLLGSAANPVVRGTFVADG
ncbi:hypothetical protein SAMN05443637_111144 [Pseudonocardia thermophila]|uniref:Uncharacterized protein n=1 Tax=Pseudonocardia thermophila TaxID=1848 RepID=A0A1M6V1K9_PSETH|nr:hypothetical protein [Pseudonocardia thermophila]SHK75382.1 hypothetical protein SAMN05443637_111144 [Pseudonocardia thermophila]